LPGVAAAVKVDLSLSQALRKSECTREFNGLGFPFFFLCPYRKITAYGTEFKFRSTSPNVLTT
jgi:hypothetical protein